MIRTSQEIVCAFESSKLNRQHMAWKQRMRFDIISRFIFGWIYWYCCCHCCRRHLMLLLLLLIFVLQRKQPSLISTCIPLEHKFCWVQQNPDNDLPEFRSRACCNVTIWVRNIRENSNYWRDEKRRTTMGWLIFPIGWFSIPFTSINRGKFRNFDE